MKLETHFINPTCTRIYIHNYIKIMSFYLLFFTIRECSIYNRFTFRTSPIIIFKQFNACICLCKRFTCTFINRINFNPFIAFIIKSNKPRGSYITLINIAILVKSFSCGIIICLCMQICNTKQCTNSKN